MKETEMEDDAAARKADALNLHPICNPLGDDHHTNIPLSDEDKEIGGTLAWFMGTMWSGVSYEDWYSKTTSGDEWARVARALRIHGLMIADKPSNATIMNKEPKP